MTEYLNIKSFYLYISPYPKTFEKGIFRNDSKLISILFRTNAFFPLDNNCNEN